MKNAITLTFITLFFFACKKDFNSTDASIQANNHVDNLTFTTTGTQFGVLVNAAYANQNPGSGDTKSGLNDSLKLIIDSVYGAKNIRTEVNHDEWTNTNSRNKFLTFFKNLWNKGFAVALNIKWNASGSDTPVVFADSIQYANFVKEVLDSIDGRSDAGKHMKPKIVVVENEESNASYYDNNSQAKLDRYLGMLRQAAVVCNSKSVLITNGGMVAFYGTILTWDWLKTKYGKPVANTWAKTVLTANAVTALNLGAFNSQINLGKYLVNNYAQINNLSYINLHWYEPIIARYWPEGGASPYDAPYNNSKDSTIAGGLDSVVRYYNNTVPGLKLITNETGQLTYSSILTNNIVNMYKGFKTNGGNFSIAIWYDGDSDFDEVISGSKALHNALTQTSYSLRSSGTKFKNLMH